MRDVLLLQTEIEIGIGKAAGAPMLGDDNVAGLWREIGMPFAAPCPARDFSCYMR